VNDAIARGLDYLAAQQDPAGFWEDWELPVGSSRMWTTAYVGWRLGSCGLVTKKLERAADWLEANELDGGGWGYTESTGADADSTSLGILFFHSIGRPVSATALRRLLCFHRDDGGFGTYGLEQSFEAWTASQVEVTATAALALETIEEAPDIVERAKAYLRRRRRGDGIWDSYWWTSPYYATEVAVRLLGEEARQEACVAMRKTGALNSFEAALRSLVFGCETESLQEAQTPDGSWPTAPILRLTHRNVYFPQSSDDAGPCFADSRRVFTTATAVCALAACGAEGYSTSASSRSY
jgi:hypothetical protein